MNLEINIEFPTVIIQRKLRVGPNFKKKKNCFRIKLCFGFRT